MLATYKTDGSHEQNANLLAMRIEAALADDDFDSALKLTEQIPGMVFKSGKSVRLLSTISNGFASPDRLVAMMALTGEPNESANAAKSGSVTLKSGTTITEISRLQKNPFKLVSVNVSGSPKVNDKSMVLLGELTEIQDLDVSETNVSDSSSIQLMRLQTLESLNIAGTKITELTLSRIMVRLHNLKVLKIGKLKVSAKTMTEFRERLPNCLIETEPK